MEPVYDINDDAKRDVLAATDLVALIGATTSLKKAGSSWKGLCPFHGEKTPSFYVHPAKGFYYCFGCGTKGDAITFVRETERLDFPEAVAYLARLAGITLPVRRGGTRADRSKETRVTEVLAASARFFREQLSRHAAARALLSKRGVPPAESADFGMGAAPDAWDALKTALSASFPEEVLIEAGVVQRSLETGRVYDRFRNRLTIEIRDARGEVLGFGARALGDDEPKYLNSPESSRFSKGRLLYGLDRAKEAIRKADAAVLVEGYFDRIALEKAGLANSVASMGTALTTQQADLLARHATTVVVGYDGDSAGQAAARKAFPLLLERGSAVRHLALPDGHDPDSFLAERGVEALREEVEKAVPVLESLAGWVPPPSADPSERAARVNEAAGILNAASDPVLRHELLARFSKLVGVPHGLLSGGAGKKTGIGAVSDTRDAAPERLPESEEKVLRIVLSAWPESAPLAHRIPPDIFMHPVAKEIFTLLRAKEPGGGTLDFSELQSHLGDGAGRVVARLLLTEPENPLEKSEGNVAGERERNERKLGLADLHKPLLQLKIRQLEEKGATLQPEIHLAEASGNPGRREELLREKQRLSAEIHRLKKELRRPLEPGSGSDGR